MASPLFFLDAQNVTAHRLSKLKQNNLQIIFNMSYWHSDTDQILKVYVKIDQRNQKGK